MKRLYLLLVACFLLATGSAGAQSAVPGKINYQGQLVDSSGTPLTNGDYVLSFRIYNQNAPGGTLMWGPQRFDGVGGTGHNPPATLVSGQFNVALDVDTNGILLGSVFTNAGGGYWLEITISTNSPISPRQQILSAPLALKAANSELLSGLGWEAVYNNGNPVTGFIPGSKLVDGSVTTAKLGPGAVGPGQISAATVTTSNLTDQAVGTTQIAPSAITTALIAPNAVTSAQIASNAVTTAQLANLAVTTAQLANFAVTTSKIATGAVTTAQIASNSVTPSQLNLQFGNVAIGQPTAFAPLDIFTTNGGFATRIVSSVGPNPTRYVYFADGTYAIYCGGPVQVYGNVNITGNLTKSTGTFKIDHPTDPANKYLSHSFVESPDMKNIYDGVVVLDSNGEALVELPEWFEALNRDFRYQLTAIGVAGPNLHISREIANNQFRIAGGGNGMKVSWQVTGIRQDAYASAHPIRVEEDKPAELRGYYLTPLEYGQPIEKGIQAATRPGVEAPHP